MRTSPSILLLLLAAGCTTGSIEGYSKTDSVIAHAISDRLLLELTAPDNSQYEYGIVNLAGGAGIRIPRDIEFVPAVQIGVFLWAEIAALLADKPKGDQGLSVKIPFYEIYKKNCAPLDDAVGTFRSSIGVYMGNAQNENYKTEPPDHYQVDGTSFLIQFTTPDGRVILNPGPYSELHEITSVLQRTISRCYKDTRPKYIGYDF